MKKFTLILLALAAFAFCVSANAWALSGWADSVIAADKGTFSSPTDLPSQALGPYDSLSIALANIEDSFYQMGDANGYLTVGFANSIILGPGTDVQVYEFGSPETFSLKLSLGGTVFSPTSNTLFGRRADNGDPLNVYTFDLGDSGLVDQLTLFDGYHGSQADIDAIQGLSVTPEPLAMVLFLVGGVPIAANLYRKRSKAVRV